MAYSFGNIIFDEITTRRITKHGTTEELAWYAPELRIKCGKSCSIENAKFSRKHQASFG